MGEALGNVRICDFTGQLAGAGATKVPGRLRGRGDPHRGPGHARARGTSCGERRRSRTSGAASSSAPAFNNHNVNKLGITLNLRTERAKELLAELVRPCDVVTENFAAGVLERMGLRLRAAAGAAARHHLRVATAGSARPGPYGTFKSWGPIAQAVSRADLHRRACPTRPPAGWGYSLHGPHRRLLHGHRHPRRAVPPGPHRRGPMGRPVLHRGRRRTLHGPALLDCDGERAAHAPRGLAATPTAARGPPWPPTASTPRPARASTASERPTTGWPSPAATTPTGPRWPPRSARRGPSDDACATLAGRLERQDELDAQLAALDRAPRPLARLAASLLARGGARRRGASDRRERIDDDHDTAAWGLWPTVDHAAMGEVRVDGLPVHLSETDWRISRAAPCLGQHNDQVLRRAARPVRRRDRRAAQRRGDLMAVRREPGGTARAVAPGRGPRGRGRRGDQRLRR